MDEQFEALICRMAGMEKRVENLEATLQAVLDPSAKGCSELSEHSVGPLPVDASQGSDVHEKTWEKSEEAFVWEIVSREYANVMDAHSHTPPPKKATSKDMQEEESVVCDPPNPIDVDDEEGSQVQIERMSMASEDADDDLESPLTARPAAGFEEFHVGDHPDENGSEV
jgi:hypothetical protein